MIKVAQRLEFNMKLTNALTQWGSVQPVEGEELRIDLTKHRDLIGIMISDREFKKVAWVSFDPTFEAADIRLASLEKSMIVEDKKFMTPPNQPGSGVFFYRKPEGQSTDDFVGTIAEMVIKFIRGEDEDDNRRDPE